MTTKSDKKKAIAIRTTPCAHDSYRVQRILESAGHFRHAEINVALELVDEWHVRGEEASGYHFAFAEDEVPSTATERTTHGFACFGPIACAIFRWDIHWIAVHKESRGKGVGAQLLAVAEAEAAKHGAVRMYIDTSGRDEYIPTRRFYENHGYRAEVRLKDFYADCDDKLVYVKLLTMPDDPEADCTDFAHPAWWRGEKYGVREAVRKVNEILDGKDDGKGVCGDDLGQETLRQRLLELVGKACRRCHTREKVVSGVCDKCFDPAGDIWARPDPDDPLFGACQYCNGTNNVDDSGVCDNCRGDPPPPRDKD